MDHWIIQAEAEKQDGTRGTFTVKFSERDSESTSDEECMFYLIRAADKCRLKIVGPMSVVDDPSK